MEKSVIKIPKLTYFIPLGVIFTHLVLLLATQFTAWPEMLAWPYLTLKGFLPYRDIAIAHTPLLLIKLAFFYRFFGVGIIQLKIFTWLLLIFTDLLLYFTTYKLEGEKKALFTLLLSIPLQLLYQVNGLWFELLLTPLILVFYYCLKTGRYLLAGFFLALGILTKQTGIYFFLPVLVFLFHNRKKFFYVLSRLLLGGLIPVTLLVISLFVFGITKDFWQWAVKYGVFILPRLSGQVLLPTLKQAIIFLIPLGACLLSPAWLPWVLAGSLGVFPRWELFHLQPALPFVALALAQASKSRSRKVKTVALVLSVFVLLLFFRSSYLTWGKETRFYEKNVQEIVAYIQAKTLPKDRIYILNSWDSLYALSDRLPAPGILIPHLPWYLDQSEIQEKVVSGLKKNPAKLLVVNPPAAVGLGAYRPEKIWQTILKDYRKTDTVAGYDIYIQK